jgi:hypothetical protein
MTPAEYLYVVAESLGQREDGIGGLAPDGPSSEEVRAAGDFMNAFLDKDGDQSGYTPNELWEAMNYLAAISDKWIDPEADPLGNDAREFLENSIHEIIKLLDQYVPDAAENQQRWADLRALNHAIARSLLREKLNPPSRIEQIKKSISLPIKTCCATLLYRTGKLLKTIARSKP